MTAADATVSTELLQCQGLHVALGGQPVLRGIDLALKPGWTAIVGPNGAGKSTLLRALAGLQPLSQGGIRLGGHRLQDLPAAQRARRLAWLAQGGQTTGELNVRETVQLGRIAQRGLLGALGADDARAVEHAMQETGCAAWASRQLQALSGGERQRVLVARALAVEAPVLLLDEPVAHLDAPHQVALLRTLRQRARDGAAVLAVLHDLNLALAADRVLVMDRGRLVADGPPGDAALHATLTAVFEHAVTVQPAPDGRRWMAVPTV